jgi:hypothetical protein
MKRQLMIGMGVVCLGFIPGVILAQPVPNPPVN